MNKRVILACLMAVSVGCGGTPPATDSGTGGTDAFVEPMVDTGVPPADTGPVAQPAIAVAAPNTLDIACVGSAMRPTGGAATSATLEITEYLSSGATPTTNTTAQVFTTDAITATCTAPDCVSGMTDAMGHVTLSAPAGGWFALHLLASADTAEVLAYNQTWPSTAGDTLGTSAFAPSSVMLVAQLIGRQFQAATAGAISGQFSDCMGHTVANAQPRVFHGTERIVDGTGNTSPRIVGLMSTTVTRGPLFLTGSGGVFVGANVPVGDDYHVEMWGVTTAGAEPVLLGCEEGRVVAGAITVLVIGPLRTDYEAGSACAMAAAAAP